MSTYRPLAAALLAAAALTFPTAAAAKGTASAPPPAPTVTCDYSLDGPTDAGYVFSNQAADAGCISVISTPAGLRLYALALTPGWTADVRSDGGGTDGGVRVIFTRTATGDKVEARIEPGKTVIR